jgi:hypothetical protein
MAVRMAVLLRNRFVGHDEPKRFDKYQFGAQSTP